MKAYNARKMSKEQKKANKGSLRVSFTDESVNHFITKVKEGFEIIYAGKYHSSCKKRGLTVEVEVIKRG